MSDGDFQIPTREISPELGKLITNSVLFEKLEEFVALNMTNEELGAAVKLLIEYKKQEKA